MSSFSAIRGGGIFLATLVLVPWFAPLARADAVDLKVLQSLVRVEVTTPQGPRVATGCVVTAEGLVATCIDAIENVTQASVVFAGGQRYPVEGFVAISSGKGLILLSPQKRAQEKWTPLEISDKAVAPGDPVVLYSSLTRTRPLLPGAPIPVVEPIFAEGTIRRAYSGEEHGYGLLPPFRVRPDADTYCFRVMPEFAAGGIAGLARNASARYRQFKLNPNGPDGAGFGWGVVVTDARGNLLGMLVPPSTDGERGWPAVHAIHIRSLLPKRKPTVRSFRSRKTVEEPVPLEASPQPSGSTLVTGAVKRGLSPAENVQAIGERLAGIAAQRTAVDEDLAYLASLIQETNLVGAELNRLRKDESRKVTETREVETKEKDKDGDKITKREKVEVTYYSFSEARINERARVANRLTKLGSDAGLRWIAHDDGRETKNSSANPSPTEFNTELQVLNYWHQIGLPADAKRIQRVERETAAELFYRFGLDVFGSEPELQQADAALSELIRPGTSNGMLYLARGVLRVRLRSFDAATKDVKQAVVTDGSLEHVALGVRGWLEMRRGDPTGAKTIASAAKAGKQDPRVSVLEALCALENHDLPRFQKLLKQALEEGGDPAEIHRVLALFCATGLHTAKNAMNHAQRACAATSWSDWRTLLALAAAQAEDSHFEEAQATVVRAARAAPGSYRAKCREWHDTFAAKERLKLNWNEP